MDRALRIVRNVTFLVLLIAAAVAMEKKVFAISCGSYFYGFTTVSMSNCGGFTYESGENGALQWMKNDADWRCQAYMFPPADEAYLYWWYREGDFQEEAYYSSSWECLWY